MPKIAKITTVKTTENLTKLILSVDAVLVNHVQITSARLHTLSGAIFADSTVTPANWDFTNAGFITVKLGKTDLPAGINNCILVVTDSTHLTGLAWQTQLEITNIP
jgi:hypothetical protein